jgi:hypothetical protein
MSRRDTFRIRFILAGLCRISEAARLSIPLIVILVELKWKFKCPWMHRQGWTQLLIGVLLPNVAVNLANLPKYLFSSPSWWAWLAKNLKKGTSSFATSKWKAFFSCSL